jgi:hypothetical protein
MKPPDELSSLFLENQFHNPVGIKKVRVALHIGGDGASLDFCQEEVLVVPEGLLDHHFIGSAEDGVSFLEVQVLIWVSSGLPFLFWSQIEWQFLINLDWLLFIVIG